MKINQHETDRANLNKGGLQMRKVRVFSFVMFVLLLTCAMAGFSFAHDIELNQLSEEQFRLLLWGGLLYDNWLKELGVKIEDTHPSYPSEGKKKGKDTWRCKECHGWDYKGKDGDYSKGSHYTGIKGIRDFAHKSPEEIMAILKNDIHAFGKKMPEEAYKAISLFVAYGQIDMDEYIERSTKKVKGDLSYGARIYVSTCAKCHGTDGKRINFKTTEKPEYLGTLCNKNPWEALHKIRFGQPSEEMISLLFLDTREQIDVLSYCQTLPIK